MNERSKTEYDIYITLKGGNILLYCLGTYLFTYGKPITESDTIKIASVKIKKKAQRKACSL